MEVLYVYYGTAGLTGAYVHGIAQSVQKLQQVTDIECHWAVNWYYRFTESQSKVVRLFFPLTEMDGENRFLRFPMVRWLRLPIRYIELVMAYLYLLFYVAVRHIDVVNVSLIADRIPTVLFALGVKALGRELFITAHDSVPLDTRMSMRRRGYVFHLANRVIAHYEHVRQDLMEHFGLPSSKIFLHPYPWSEITSILDETQYLKYYQAAREIVRGFDRVFLFIGVLRPEKGLASLASAWGRARLGLGERCLLLVAGRPVPGPLDARETFRGLSNVKLIDRYLDVEEFWAILNVADVVVFPYAARYYAHSAVVLLAFLASKCVVASDIPLFEHLVDSDNGFRFKADDVDDLARVLVQVEEEDAETLQRKGEIGKRRVIAGWAGLESALAELYSPRSEVLDQ